ncbi:MAG TPA: NADH-quinone oxidoreductase subunit L [Polyangiaceae bacterium]|nr:NADH-quinone oxidoreductase subunit L [Polyangiaceae bacterium]
MNSAWSILLLPLLAAAVLSTRLLRGQLAAAAISVGTAFISLAQALRLFMALRADALADWQSEPLSWLVLPGGAHFDVGVLVDSPSVLLILIVSTVGFLVQLFSVGYMKDDPGIARYFAFLSFFTFSMLGIVLAPNLIQMFIFWELVGLASYLLIGFWFERNSAGDAAKKALLANRVGDFGFMCGILMVWAMAGTLDFGELAKAWPAVQAAPAILTLAGVLVFCGAVGKSAQLPLHVWLPDAMEGPTPVSALIHAATMVAAGVYMLYRTSFLWEVSTDAGDIVAWIGALTSLFAALIAIAQRDVKRVLAYSTLSQLGYMVMAVGVGSKVSGLFHLTTHACFKALLFLSAGSIIHALHHEQDIWKMGGLWRKLPLTAAAFGIGALALAGVWPLSGFYSKDAILLSLVDAAPGLFEVAIATALLTPFYIGRTWILVFLGKSRNEEATSHAHEAPWMMALPLVVLALLSVVSGWGGFVPELLEPGVVEHHAEGSLAILLPALPAFGFIAAWLLYGQGKPASAEADPLARGLGAVFGVLERRLLVDELYEHTVLWLQDQIASVVDAFERYVMGSALPTAVGGWIGKANRGVKAMQSGHVGAYLFAFGAGAALLFFLLVRL